MYNHYRGIDMKNKIIKQIPNIITLSRIMTTIIGFILFCNHRYTIAIIMYIYGAVSDFLDGYLARRLSAYSKLGKYLDAVSDKLYSFSSMILLIIYRNIYIMIPLILEVIIAVINYFNIIINKKVYTERVGKYKMTLEFLMIITSLLAIKIKQFTYIFYVILVLTIYFQIQAIFAYINQLRGKTKEEIINVKNKTIREKVKTLLNEFIFYLIHPIRIIK